MDHEANIKEQRDLAQRIVALSDKGFARLDDGDVNDQLDASARLAELVLALDQWSRTGGFEPKIAIVGAK